MTDVVLTQVERARPDFGYSGLHPLSPGLLGERVRVRGIRPPRAVHFQRRPPHPDPLLHADMEVRKKKGTGPTAPGKLHILSGLRSDRTVGGQKQQSVCAPVGVSAPDSELTGGQIGAVGVPVNPALPSVAVKLQSLVFDWSPLLIPAVQVVVVPK
jgi:hypothetical protein